jgi:hypothetical protein
MSGNIQKSTSLSRIVEDIAHLKQQLEYFERHIHNVRNEVVKKEYFRTLSKVLEAEQALRHFNNVFNESNSYPHSKPFSTINIVTFELMVS